MGDSDIATISPCNENARRILTDAETVQKQGKDWSGWIQFLSAPAFAYVLIILLQLKTMWGVWDFKDLASNDTSYYYCFTYNLLHTGHIGFAWAPLYQLFSAAIMSLNSDPLFWCISQRLICACVLSVMVLAVMRRLIKSPLSWHFAAWFALLAINFDSPFVNHIFAAIAVLAAWLAALAFPGRWGRAACLAIFIANGCLLRNEVLISAAIYAAAVVFYESRALLSQKFKLLDASQKLKTFDASKKLKPFDAKVFLPYLVSLSLVFLLVSAVFLRSDAPFSNIIAQFGIRHACNVGQMYAYGHQQRHPEWTKSPWTEYPQLSQEVFGIAYPTFFDATIHNPRAVLEHIGWNVSLLPSGFQLMLFNCISGRTAPDYEPIVYAPQYAIPFSCLALAISIAGFVCLYRERREFLIPWLRQNAWGLIAMMSSCALCIMIMIAQRPRPAYLFPLSATLMCFLGLSVWRLLKADRLHPLGRLVLIVSPVLIIALAPCHYIRHHSFDRPLFESWSFLQPFARTIAQSNEKILVPNYSYELMAYLYGNGDGPARGSCIQLDPHADFSRSLEEPNVGWMFLDKGTTAVHKDFEESAHRKGWLTVAFRDTQAGRSVLLHKGRQLSANLRDSVVSR